MSCIFPWIVLTAFWTLVIRLWFFDGPKLPLVFIGLWCVGLFVCVYFKLGSHIFMGFEAVLSLAGAARPARI
ncbi:MAG: hypothetical protein ACYTAO_17005 [Planctomycetota bacterium]|jgi:hypothetical protein